MPIYTKKGDKGETGLFSKDKDKKIRIGKDSLRVEAIGCIDELDSFLGVTGSFSEDPKMLQIIKEVQRNLLTVGSNLAGSGLSFSKRETTKLEKQIDEWDKILPPLKNFILPGGSKLSAHFQYCRSLARRAERRVVGLSKVEKVSPQILMYMNRLSDFFFMCARKVNNDLNLEDELWVGSSKKTV